MTVSEAIHASSSDDAAVLTLACAMKFYEDRSNEQYVFWFLPMRRDPL